MKTSHPDPFLAAGPSTFCPFATFLLPLNPSSSRARVRVVAISLRRTTRSRRTCFAGKLGRARGAVEWLRDGRGKKKEAAGGGGVSGLLKNTNLKVNEGETDRLLRERVHVLRLLKTFPSSNGMLCKTEYGLSLSFVMSRKKIIFLFFFEDLLIWKGNLDTKVNLSANWSTIAVSRTSPVSLIITIYQNIY